MGWLIDLFETAPVDICIEDIAEGRYNLQLVVDGECLSWDFQEASAVGASNAFGRALVPTHCSYILWDGAFDFGMRAALADINGDFGVATGPGTVFPTPSNPTPIQDDESGIIVFTISVTDNSLHTYVFIGNNNDLAYTGIPSDEVILGIKVVTPTPGTTFIIGVDSYSSPDVRFSEIDYHVGDRDLDPELNGNILEFRGGCESVDLSGLGLGGGSDGDDGFSFLGGIGSPPALLGNDGDHYVNVSSGETYQKSAGIRMLDGGNLMGPPGNDGAQGPQGDPGADGSVWYNGAVAPVGENDGDYWLDTTNGDVYQSQVPMGWVLVGNILGPQGAPGNDGIDGINGVDGAQGPQGDPGPAGADGADGAQGPQGDPGADGAQGPQGDPGVDGADGMQPCNLVQDDFPDELMLIEFYETPAAPGCYVAGANVNYGFYTPVLTNVANLDASLAFEHTWMRVGNVVHVAGRIEVNPTTPTAVTQLGISLPYVSDIQGLEGVCGVAACPGIISQSAAILGDAVNNRAQMEWISGDTTAQSMYHTFQYYIV